MKTLFSSVALVCLLCGCAGMNAEPKSNYDKFTGVTINSTQVNTLPNHFPENFTLTLDMRQEVGPSSTNYFLVVGSLSLYGLKMPGYGESLFVLADSNRLAFSTDLRFQQNALGGNFFYPASSDQLKTIAFATNVEVRIVGITGGRFERKLAPKNVSNFREFAEKYIR